MRAVQVVEPTGPSGVRVVDVAEPEPGPGDVVVDVHAVGVSFPDLLLSQGRYQVRPETPSTLGVDLAGTVVSAPEGVPGLEPGGRVAGVVPYGGAAECAVVPASAVFPLPDRTSYAEGAALPMNYLTALFALRERGQVRAGETVLVHGAAGGVGFASGQGIPEVRVNRLLLNNVDVRGVGWGAFAMTKPTYMREQWDLLLPMIESGVVSPPIGATYDLADFPRALQDVADRRTLGKNVVRLR